MLYVDVTRPSNLSQYFGAYVEMKFVEISTIDQASTRKQANDLIRNDDRVSTITSISVYQSMDTTIIINVEFNYVFIGIFVFVDCAKIDYRQLISHHSLKWNTRD